MKGSELSAYISGMLNIRGFRGFRKVRGSRDTIWDRVGKKPIGKVPPRDIRSQ